MQRGLLLFVACAISLIATAKLAAEEPAASRRLRQAQEFHLRAQERTGLLIPLYVYPANVRTNPHYNGLLELRRRYETVPVWVIVNPASGPGRRVDPNYTRAIDRLLGAGCVVLGYVATSYGKRPAEAVQNDIDQWLTLYPHIQGVFFDEMIYEDTAVGAQYQAALRQYAHNAGLWPTVANPGADTPGRYFSSHAADVIVVHEGAAWPSEERLKGDRAGGYADFPPFTRAILVHSQPEWDSTQFAMARKYVRWIYVTEAPFRPGDPQAANPWDRLSMYLDTMCAELAKQ